LNLQLKQPSTFNAKLRRYEVYREHRKNKLKLIGLRLKTLLLGSLLIFCLTPHSQARNEVEISTNFLGKELSPTDKIELRLNQPLKANEGTLAVFLNQTDLTAFFIPESNNYSYTPKVFPLPVGDNKLSVYVVSPQGEWLLLRELLLKVAEKKESKPEKREEKEDSKTEFEFTPNLSLNFKGESNVGFFPQFSRPSRLAYLDTGVQGNLQISVKRNGWTLNSQFDVAGSSRQQEALRFGELGAKAPKIDLSSYQVGLEKGRFNLKLGHLSLNRQRHFISNFESRGLQVTVPVGQQNEVTFSALNGSSIVGYDNFLGFTRASHQLLSLTFAREFIKERPGGLRLEVTAMRGSILPLDGFNERAVRDAEKNSGGSVRLQFSDKSGRLRLEGGFTRSRFRNPPDPFISEGITLETVRPTTRNARYLEVSFDFFRNVKVGKTGTLNLTGTFRHEELQPLFRSLAAFNQADRRQNQFEVTGSLGQINFTFGNLRDRDNLDEIVTILKTLGRRNNIVLSIPLNTLFTSSKPLKWLPRIGYNFGYFHQFGAFRPENGDFREDSQVPDQKSYSQNFNADWSLTGKLQLGYRYSRSFQDNRQAGRERADFLNISNAVNLGFSGIKNIDLNFSLSRESANSFEQSRLNNTFRLGTNITWRDAILKNLTFNTNFSTTIAGDRAATFEAENFEYDAQLAYRFAFGSQKFKKMNAQIFVRYANRYGRRFDRVFFLNDFNKRQGFNLGLNFSFF
jgi:hypothetical protein